MNPQKPTPGGETGKPAAPPPNRSPRRRARELAVQGLYQWRVGGQDAAAIEAHLSEHEDFRAEFKRADQALFHSLLRGALRESEQLFALLAPFLDRNVGELSPIETSVLLLGAYELAHHPETPYRVILNEAIELAKTFGGTDGHKYVNGVLDKLGPSLRPGEAMPGRGRREKA